MENPLNNLSTDALLKLLKALREAELLKEEPK